jgi:hypothetical protein
MLKQLIEDFRQGLIEGEREMSVAAFGAAMIDAVTDARLTDVEVADLCELYDRLGITSEEWQSLRGEVWQSAQAAATMRGIDETALRELRGIQAFLGGTFDQEAA